MQAKAEPAGGGALDARVARAVHACRRLYAIALPGSFMVFALYWLLVYPAKAPAQKAVEPFLSYMTHGANFGVMFVDACVNAQPYNLMSGAYFLMYALTYLAWSVVFDAAGLETACSCADDDGTDNAGCRDRGDEDESDGCNYIYSSLNWNVPAATAPLAVAIVLVVAPLIVLTLWFAVLLRRVLRAGYVAPEPPRLQRTTSAVYHEEGCCAALRFEIGHDRARTAETLWVEHYGRSKASWLRHAPARFLGIRAGLLLVMFVTLLWSFAHNAANGKAGLWFVYLTHWTLAVEVAYLACVLWLGTHAVPLFQGEEGGTPETSGHAAMHEGAVVDVVPDASTV